jgi:PucR family transcriptional regulator, purine catabolism regulatory protein
MGISVQELLANEFFKDFEVIAGRKGLHKEMQGITVFEAPDAFKWTKGKEMVLSSGYVIQQNPDCLNVAFAEGNIQRSSGLILKRDRYMDSVPEDIIELFNDNELPLILAPFSVPWMDIISQSNVAVMNRAIMKFQVSNAINHPITNQSYKEKKIKQILSAVENEMKFPAFLHDFTEDKSYYSSPNFRRMTELYNLKETEYWNPSVPYTHHTLCDYINMSRYRLIQNERNDDPRVSWIIMPITVNGVLQAYFVLMEARDLIDYYDEFTIRIAFMVLQSLYEQIGGAKDVGYMGFENFIHFAMSCGEEDAQKVISQASIQGISMSIPYDYVLVRADNINLSTERPALIKVFQKSGCSRRGQFAILDDNHILVLLESTAKEGRNESSKPSGDTLIRKFLDSFRSKFPDATIACSICQEGKTLRDIKSSINKCHKVLRMGQLIYPEQDIYDYEMLGPLTWLDIPENELQKMLSAYQAIQDGDRDKILVKTLKVYLENNMNYSITAEKMYVHINTIRKRIDKINKMLDIDWNNPVERMKNIILLQFIKEE